MYHLPTKKEPKKHDPPIQPNRNQSGEKPNFIQRNKEVQSTKRLTDKNIKNATIPKPTTQKTIPQKVEHLEKAVQKLSMGVSNPNMQKLLLEQIKGIKSELREIKQQIGLGSLSTSNKKHRQDNDQKQQEEVQENIAQMIPRERVQKVNRQQSIPINNRIDSRSIVETNQMKNSSVKHTSFEQYHSAKPKDMIDIGRIQPYMKEFKLDATKMLLPFYRGYHKKSSKPIVVKYCSENQTMDSLINLYEKLWKNIVKAKKVCINKVYDLNQPLANYIMALEMNKFQIHEINMQPFAIIKEVLRGIQFFHQCGYLYRNVHPDHVMMNFEGNIVLLDFKLARRWADMKGKIIEVKGNTEVEGVNQFMSNSRLRNMPEGRKDDLECLGYLALFLIQGKLPWGSTNIVQIRSKCTLQQLYGRYEALFQMMVSIHKMGIEETPDYDRLCNLMSQ